MINTVKYKVMRLLATNEISQRFKDKSYVPNKTKAKSR